MKKGDDALIGAFESGLENQVRSAARAHTSAAIGTLATLMKGKTIPPNVRRQSAMDLLSQAWGRPDAREDAAGQKKGSSLTIVINRLFDGKQETIEMDIANAKSIAASVDAMSEDPPNE